MKPLVLKYSHTPNRDPMINCAGPRRSYVILPKRANPRRRIIRRCSLGNTRREPLGNVHNIGTQAAPPVSPKSWPGPRCANFGLMHRSSQHLYSITSSARASTVAGISRPSDLAAFRLMTNSNLVGRITGRSAGFSPLRMRPA